MGGVSHAEQQWATQSYVQIHQLREVHKLVLELTDRLGQLHITPSNLQRPDTQNQDTVLKVTLASRYFLSLTYNELRRYRQHCFFKARFLVRIIVCIIHIQLGRFSCHPVPSY